MDKELHKVAPTEKHTGPRNELSTAMEQASACLLIVAQEEFKQFQNQAKAKLDGCWNEFAKGWNGAHNAEHELFAEGWESLVVAGKYYGNASWGKVAADATKFGAGICQPV